MTSVIPLLLKDAGSLLTLRNHLGRRVVGMGRQRRHCVVNAVVHMGDHAYNMGMTKSAYFAGIYDYNTAQLATTTR